MAEKLHEGIKIPGKPYPSWRYHANEVEYPAVIVYDENDDMRAIVAGYHKNKALLHKLPQIINPIEEFKTLNKKQLKSYAHAELGLVFTLDMAIDDMIAAMQSKLCEISESGRMLGQEIPGHYKQWQADISDAFPDVNEGIEFRS